MTPSSYTFHDNWRLAARVFLERADEYDSWYEDSLLVAEKWRTPDALC